ncbi:MAG: arylsulfatase [Blautia sp.]|jgi:arylsulfatase
MDKKNILLIMTDQLRGDCLGYAGHPDIKTPYLDSLASRGVSFDNAYSACPSCIAARAALHTGMAQEHHRRVGYQDGIPWEYEHTLARELSENGYQTQCVGKMHVHPLRNYLGFQGVDLHDGYLHSARYASVPWKESQKNADDYFHWLKTQLGADADVTDTGLECNSWAVRPWIYEEKYHPTNWVTDRSIDFLRRKDPGRPFFLMDSYLRPHPPLDPPQYYLDLYLHKKLTPPAVGDWENDALLKEQGRIFDSACGPLDPELIHQAQAGYYGCITHLDHQIGRLLQALVEYEEYDNTLILFTSDHGEELCDHHRFRKSMPYEGSCRIPMILSGREDLLPRKKTGSVCHSLVELRDVMPTLLDFAGAPVPDSVDGRSMLPLAADPEKEIRPYLHGEHSYGEYSNHWIVTPEDKYVWFSQTGEEQYFHLTEDPHECKNLIHDPYSQDLIEELRVILIKELSGRPEGFIHQGKLIPGRPYAPYLEP